MKMNYGKSGRIENAFKNGKAFIAFLTGGDPSLEKSAEFILEAEKAGADLVEIGIPFSDPIAEGEVIQAANIRALSGGVTVHGIFELVSMVRQKSEIPLVFLTYLNPVYYYGYEKFFAKCKEMGVDGIIVPDLPFEEQMELKTEAQNYGIDLISLIAPTSSERAEMIAKESSGFLYIVSSMGVTGVRSEIKTDVASIVSAAKAVSKTPCAVGFGINTPEQAAKFAKVSDGVIVGSAIVKIIEKHGENAGKYVYEYVKEMKRAII
ncbi:MAG: tryptophan synthase subunit alpha [Fibromonadaceae bacterium]|jgi:tryptophan synthase alpha chain|nr:tryptophan synthase subunit alpha [Fibromonadaceae bacterium]